MGLFLWIYIHMLHVVAINFNKCEVLAFTYFSVTRHNSKTQSV